MHLSLPWSWIVGAVAALIVIASLAASRRRLRDAGALEPPAPQLDDSGTFPVLTPPEEPAEILVPPGEPERPVVSLNDVALDDVPVEEPADAAPAPAAAAALPLDALPPDEELDDALDDALDRVVK